MSAELLRVRPATGELGRKSGVLVAGLLLTILGPAAIALPYVAGPAAETVNAALIAASGLIQLHQAFVARLAPRAFRRGVSGLLWFTAGVVFLVSPLGAASLSWLVAALIGGDGFLRLIEGARLRGRDKGWVWLFLAGALTLSLAALIAFEPRAPEPPSGAIGSLLGLTLVIDGATLILARRLLR